MRNSRRLVALGVGTVALATAIAIIASTHSPGSAARQTVKFAATGAGEEVLWRGAIWTCLTRAIPRLSVVMTVDVLLFVSWHVPSVLARDSSWTGLPVVAALGVVFCLLESPPGASNCLPCSTSPPTCSAPSSPASRHTLSGRPPDGFRAHRHEETDGVPHFFTTEELVWEPSQRRTATSKLGPNDGYAARRAQVGYERMASLRQEAQACRTEGEAARKWALCFGFVALAPCFETQAGADERSPAKLAQILALGLVERGTCRILW